LNYHIASICGHDVEPCKAAIVETQRFCYVALEKYEQENELKQKQLANLAQIGSNSLPHSSGNVSVSSFIPDLGSIGCLGEGFSLPLYHPSASRQHLVLNVLLQQPLHFTLLIMAPPAKKPKLSKGNKKYECWK